MMGNTQFNSHMFSAEHLMLEDESESVDIRSRRNFAANIKTILTGRNQNCHGKNREALILNPLWRMSLSLNDDPERLQVLPPLDPDVRDKITVVSEGNSELIFHHHFLALLRRATKPAPAPIATTMSAMPDGSGTGCGANETVSNPPGVQPATVCCSQVTPSSLVW